MSKFLVFFSFLSALAGLLIRHNHHHVTLSNLLLCTAVLAILGGIVFSGRHSLADLLDDLRGQAD
jgi:hypothetical protein